MSKKKKKHRDPVLRQAAVLEKIERLNAEVKDLARARGVSEERIAEIEEKARENVAGWYREETGGE